MNNPVFLSFVSILSIFAIGLVGKKYSKKAFCAMCVSVSLTWIGLLILSWIGKDIPDVLIALFMGQSIVGLLYLLEKKVPERYHIFRMPFLLSCTFIAYTILVEHIGHWMTFVFLLVIWVISFLLYVIQKRERLKDIVAHIIACCRDW